MSIHDPVFSISAMIVLGCFAFCGLIGMILSNRDLRKRLESKTACVEIWRSEARNYSRKAADQAETIERLQCEIDHLPKRMADGTFGARAK